MTAKNKTRIEVLPARVFEQEHGYDWQLHIQHNDSHATVLDLTNEDLIQLTSAATARVGEALKALG